MKIENSHYKKNIMFSHKCFKYNCQGKQTKIIQMCIETQIFLSKM